MAIIRADTLNCYGIVPKTMQALDYESAGESAFVPQGCGQFHFTIP